MFSKKQRAVFYYAFIGLSICFCVAMVYALLSAGNSVTRKTRTPSADNNLSVSADYVLTAETLYAAYKENKIAADTRYRDKIAVVSGAVRAIGEDTMGKPYILLFIGDNEFLLGGVQCYFEKEKKHWLISLSKKQRVRIRGRVERWTIGYIGIKDCVLLQTTPE